VIFFTCGEGEGEGEDIQFCNGGTVSTLWKNGKQLTDGSHKNDILQLLLYDSENDSVLFSHRKDLNNFILRFFSFIHTLLWDYIC
jgi:hypothetical protein